MPRSWASLSAGFAQILRQLPYGRQRRPHGRQRPDHFSVSTRDKGSVQLRSPRIGNPFRPPTRGEARPERRIIPPLQEIAEVANVCANPCERAAIDAHPTVTLTDVWRG